MSSHLYSQLVSYKQWANRSLCRVAAENLRRLPAQDGALLLRVMDHMHVVDRIFQRHLQGLPHDFRAPQSEHLPVLDELAEGTQAVDDWYVQYVGGLAERELAEPLDFTFTSGTPARMTRGEMLLHVCLHGQYHRGNAGALLQLRGLSPARDGFSDFLLRSHATAV